MLRKRNLPLRRSASCSLDIKSVVDRSGWIWTRCGLSTSGSPLRERVALIPWARELLSEISRGILEEGRTTDRLISEGTTSVLDKGMPKGH